MGIIPIDHSDKAFSCLPAARLVYRVLATRYTACRQACTPTVLCTDRLLTPAARRTRNVKTRSVAFTADVE